MPISLFRLPPPVGRTWKTCRLIDCGDCAGLIALVKPLKNFLFFFIGLFV
jgi:hypothetical protein